MRRSLHTQFGVIFLGFLLLVGSSVAATFQVIQTQQADAAVINLAGRQRMLTQQITRLALVQPASPELAGAVERFAQTHQALRDGGDALGASGEVVELPGTASPEIRLKLFQIELEWDTFLRQVQPPVNDERLGNASKSILAQLDELVMAFETDARARVNRLRQLQVAFLVTAFLLLGWSYLFIRRRIVQPLSELGEAADRIGQGQLVRPVHVGSEDEIGRLAGAFEIMRTEIAAAQDLLEQRVAQRTEELATAFEFSQEIVSRLDLDRLLESVTNRARTLMGAESAALCLLTEDGEFLDLVSSTSKLVDFHGIRQPVGNDFMLRVVGSGQTAITEGGCTHCGFLYAHAGGPCMAAPIRIGNQSLGAMCVVRREGAPFNEDETRSITLLANAAAIAIANARLVEMRQRQAKENAALVERGKLAADLHDNLAQTLSLLNLRAGRVETMITAGMPEAGIVELDRIRSSVQAAYKQVRAALTGLRQPPEQIDLFQEMQAFLKDFQDQTGIAAELSLEDSALLELDPVTQKQVMHIIREALINTQRHARATHVQVSVNGVDGTVCFAIQDDGQGFDLDTVSSDDHLGLAIMKARAERSDGRLTIHTTPQTGTRIEAVFPLNQP